jgi:hypothetical protein
VSPARRWAGRLLVAVAGALLALAPAAPALAHGAHAPAATNYRTEVTGIAPAAEGLTVRVIEAGTALQLTNHSGRTVQVLGYTGEPYLEIRPDGAHHNLRSPTTYQNLDPTGATPVPDRADPEAPPDWERINDTPVARWYDHRVNWQGTDPPRVAGDPGTRVRVLEWSVPLRLDGRRGQITGTLDWVAPPSPWPWWLGVALGAAAVAALGLLAHTRPARLALTLAAVAGGGLAVAYAVARELDAGATGAGQVLAWLATGLVWPVLAGLAAAAAGIYLSVSSARSARSGWPSEAGGFALAVTGACLAVFAGFANAAVFFRAVPPVAFDATAARIAVAVVLAAGVGMVAAGTLALRRAVRAGQDDPATG